MKKQYITPHSHMVSQPQQQLLVASEPKVVDGKYSDPSLGTLSVDAEYEITEADEK